MAALTKIILIDDDQDHSNTLREAVTKLAEPREFEVISWLPASEQESPAEEFNALLDTGVALVITDYDLTKSLRGFFGTSIVAWCQNKAVPVGDYSRGSAGSLPT